MMMITSTTDTKAGWCVCVCVCARVCMGGWCVHACMCVCIYAWVRVGGRGFWCIITTTSTNNQAHHGRPAIRRTDKALRAYGHVQRPPGTQLLDHPRLYQLLLPSLNVRRDLQVEGSSMHRRASR